MIVSSFRAAATTARLDFILRLSSKPCWERHGEKLQNDHPALSQRLAEALGMAGVVGVGQYPVYDWKAHGNCQFLGSPTEQR